MASQKKNLTFGGAEAFQSSLAPNKEDIPKKNDRYADDAQYAPSGVHRQTKRSLANDLS
jgi:hypothetical protein